MPYLLVTSPLVSRVLAWLWHMNQDLTMIFLADLVAQLRVHHRAAPIPALRLEDLLAGLHLAMPKDFDGKELDVLTAKARREVPGYYGSDPNR